MDSSVGGSHYSLFYLVESLDKAKYDPIVVFHRDNKLIPMYRDAGIDARVFRIKTPYQFATRLRSTMPLRRLMGFIQSLANLWRMVLFPALRCAVYLLKNRVDLVHLNNTIIRNHHWMLGATLVGAKCITHERGINERISWFSIFFSNRLAAVICISKAASDNLAQKGIRKDRLVVVHNGLDARRVQAKVEIGEIKRQLGIPTDCPVIGMVGNIKEWKGQDVVTRATAELNKRWPNLRCLLVGDTAESDKYYEKRLRQLVSELGVAQNIVFTGYQRDVANYVNIMDVVIHASVSPEPFGRVLLEAMALRKPLVGANAGAVPEIILHGETGLMCEPGNDRALARSVAELLENPQHARAMGEKGYLRLIQEFDITKNVRATQAVYERIFSEVTT